MDATAIPYLVMTAVISASIGFFAAALMAAHKIRRAEQDSWNNARRFYTHGDTTARRL